MSKEELTLEQLLERDKDKIDDLAKLKASIEVEPEWVVLAEFGIYFGWDAVRDVRNNVITSDDMYGLLAGARRVKSLNRYNGVVDTYTAFAGTQTQDGAKALKNLLGELRKA